MIMMITKIERTKREKRSDECGMEEWWEVVEHMYQRLCGCRLLMAKFDRLVRWSLIEG